MLAGHLGQTHVGTYDDTAKIWCQAGQTVDGCFEVLLMAAQVDQGDYFGAVLDDLLPILVLILIKPIRDDLLALSIEAHDLLTNGAGPASLLFVPVIEDPGPGDTVAIIGHALGEDCDEGGLAGVDVADDAQLEVLGRLLLLLLIHIISGGIAMFCFYI